MAEILRFYPGIVEKLLFNRDYRPPTILYEVLNYMNKYFGASFNEKDVIVLFNNGDGIKLEYSLIDPVVRVIAGQNVEKQMLFKKITEALVISDLLKSYLRGDIGKRYLKKYLGIFPEAISESLINSINGNIESILEKTIRRYYYSNMFFSILLPLIPLYLLFLSPPLGVSLAILLYPLIRMTLDASKEYKRLLNALRSTKDAKKLYRMVITGEIFRQYPHLRACGPSQPSDQGT